MILITGGSGSGKSEYGEYRVMEEQMPLRFYVACMEVYGEEGRRKVERHRALRAGKGFVTLERPRGLSGLSLKGEGKKAVILECVSNLAANAMFEKEGIQPDTEELAEGLFDDILYLDSQCISCQWQKKCQIYYFFNHGLYAGNHGVYPPYGAA